MIRSMTGFGGARAESPEGTLSIELRSVNSRYLDLNFRLPDELRLAEGPLRELIGQALLRGKVDVRASYTRARSKSEAQLDPAYLAMVAQQLAAARAVIPDLRAPRLTELLNGSNGSQSDAADPDAWTAACVQAAAQALGEFQSNREREGQRLAAVMLDCAAQAGAIVEQVESQLPQLLAEHQEKLANRLREALEAASPGGFAQISGAELSARIAQETSLFALRIDVAEELSRLRSHIAELEHLLRGTEAATGRGKHKAQGAPAAGGKKAAGSTGKRLDFLFQEMNREANTLGSKAGGLDVTRAAIDLKLLIEQMREQAQNLE
jgi:uncharacterized protein (TIGR00255 family)